MDSAYFALIYNFLTHKIEQFAVNGMSNAVSWVTNFAFILVTLWVFFRGYRMVTGQSHESMMATVSHMIRICLIVTVAKTMALGSISLYDFMYTRLPQQINQIVTGSDESPKAQIDKNLVMLSLATSAIDAVQVPTNDPATANEKARSSMLASLGIAGPAMTAGAMLLMYQVGLALVVGLGPLFILCLIFEQTKDFFRRWLTYAIGTMFSLAVLNAMIAIALDLTWRVAAGIWSADAITRLIGIDASPGFSTMAIQQGGVGLLMTVLIITTPPMAAAFFNGTLGHFAAFSQLGGANQAPARPGPQGQPPGTYGGGHTSPASQSRLDSPNSLATYPPRDIPQTTNPANRDTTKSFEGR